MNTLVQYSIEVSILFAILFLAYQLLFYRNSFFKLRKATLFGLMVVSFIAPLIEIEAPQPISENLPSFTPIAEIVQQPIEPNVNHPELIETTKLTTSTQWSSQEWVNLIFLAGWGISLVLLIAELFKSYLIIKKSKRTQVNFSDEIETPYSLFQKIFLPKQLLQASKQSEVIIAHEQFHCANYHTLELIIVRTLQSLLWYNPISYWFLRELKLLHEAMADQHVSQLYGKQTYLETLLSVKLSAFDISLQNTFNSQLIQRLKLMNTPKTSKKAAVAKSVVFTIFLILIISISGLKAQSINLQKSDLDPKALAYNMYFRMFIGDQLSKKHQNVFQKIHELKPFEDVGISYHTSPAEINYRGINDAVVKPLYIGKLTELDKEEIYAAALLDEKRLKSLSFKANKEDKGMGKSLYDMKEDIKEAMLNSELYVMFYSLEEFGEEIYDYNEVDIKPEPSGGIQAFERSIALDITLPEHLERSKLPSSIVFEGIVDAHSLATLNLVTEMNGSDQETLPYYRFFGSVLKEINEKSRIIYKWKRGIKDGKEVKTRVQISIPTAYFN